MRDLKLAPRDVFFNELYELAARERNIMLLSDDFGAPSLEKFKADLPGQYVMIGIAEQNMVSVAAGLALGGKTVFMYAIAPFLSLRCYEQFKLDLCCMGLPVTAVAVGAGYSYSTAGPTHHAVEDVSIMRALPGLTIYNVSDGVMAAAAAGIACDTPGPKYMRFDRDKLPLLYSEKGADFSAGLARLKPGRDLDIVATGMMVQRALKVAEQLARQGIDAGVVDLYRLKPVNEKLLLDMVHGPVVTLEEGLIIGGLGSIVAEVLADNGRQLRLKRIGTPDQFCFRYGGREAVHTGLSLDADSVTRSILEWLA